MNTKILLVLAAALFLSSCHPKKEEDKKTITLTNEQVSEWIYYNMGYIYYWEDKLPVGINPLNEKDPSIFFHNILYKQEDKWSYITSDYISFKSSLDGTPESMGISPAFGLIRNTDKVFMVIEYVYPGSPAANAGLERGDIFMSIDGIQLDTTNYSELYKQESYTAGLGEYDGSSIKSNGESVSLTSQLIIADPVLNYKIIDTLGSKIGYLSYAEFISGASNEFINSLDLVFGDFLSAGINDLVVDLRYNPGGQIDMAGYLAGCIVPITTLDKKDILVSFLYNEYLTDYYKTTYGSSSEAFYYRFPDVTFNLNLSRVYFLTTGSSASASELVISGLEPYMDVIMIGDSTYGKYTGAWVVPDTEDPPRHNWAIVPIILKYANAAGVTDFKDGLIPDYYIEDDLLNTYPFGDPKDPMLSKAIEIIGGVTETKKSLPVPRPYIDLKKPNWDVKSNLYVKPGPLHLDPNQK